MQIAYSDFDLETLHNLFRGEEDRLAADLLSGKTWQEAREQRKRLTDIAEAIYQRYYPGEAFDKAAFKYHMEEIQPKIFRSATFLYSGQLIHFSISTATTKGKAIEVEIVSGDRHFTQLFGHTKGAYQLTIVPYLPIEEQSFERSRIDYKYAEFLYNLHEAIQWVCFGYAGEEIAA